MIPPMETELLRKSVKKLLVDAELDKRGCLPEIADKMNVNYNSLNMALSGYRNSPGSIELLKQLQSYLTELLYSESATISSEQQVG